jgi:hypothetical protein
MYSVNLRPSREKRPHEAECGDDQRPDAMYRQPICLLLTHMVTDGSTGEYATHRISR